MRQISWGLLDAYDRGASVGELASRLQLPEQFVQERSEAARLCFLVLA